MKARVSSRSPSPQYVCHRQLGIVVEAALKRPTQKGEGQHVAVQKRLGGLGEVGLDEASLAGSAA